MFDLAAIEVAMRHQDRPPDAVIAQLALGQHGSVAHWQLLAIGLSASAIQRRMTAGRLHRIHRGVYSVGHKILTREGRWMAAVLACGPGALLSHRDAAALWGLRPSNSSRIDVTTRRTRHGHPGITLHQVRRLHPDDRWSIDGIPVTSLARTLLDLAEVVPRRHLDRAIERAELQGIFDLGPIDSLLERTSGRCGVGALATAIAHARPFVPLTRSALERLFLELCREAGLPEPAMNVWVGEHEVDALFADARLVIELDGAATHGTPAARERDPSRDAVLQLADYRVLRITERMLIGDPAWVVRTVRAMLAAQRRYFRKPS